MSLFPADCRFGNFSLNVSTSLSSAGVAAGADPGLHRAEELDRALLRRCGLRVGGGWALALGLLLAAGPAVLEAAAPVGQEFQVNAHTPDNQQFPKAASDAASGDFVVVWQSLGRTARPPASSASASRAPARALGSEFQVNTYTTNDQQSPVGGDGRGRRLRGGLEQRQPGRRRRTASSPGASRARGAALASEFQVNTYTTDDQRYPAVALDADGDFVVVWAGSSQDGSTELASGSSPSASPAPARAVGSRVPGQHLHHQLRPALPSVAMDADGDFVVAWNSYHPGRRDTRRLRPALRQRRRPVGRRVPGQHLHLRLPAVRRRRDGRRRRLRRRLGGHRLSGWKQLGIFAQRFTSSGVASGGDFDPDVDLPGDDRPGGAVRAGRQELDPAGGSGERPAAAVRARRGRRRWSRPASTACGRS